MGGECSQHCATSPGPGSTVEEKCKKRGQIEKNISVRSQSSGCLERGKGRRRPFPNLPYILPFCLLRSPFFFFTHADFLLLSPPMRMLQPSVMCFSVHLLTTFRFFCCVETSDHSDIESRVRRLRDQLEVRKREVKRLYNERKKQRKAMLRAQEASLRQELQV